MELHALSTGRKPRVVTAMTRRMRLLERTEITHLLGQAARAGLVLRPIRRTRGTRTQRNDASMCVLDGHLRPTADEGGVGI